MNSLPLLRTPTLLLLLLLFSSLRTKWIELIGPPPSNLDSESKLQKSKGADRVVSWMITVDSYTAVAQHGHFQEHHFIQY